MNAAQNAVIREHVDFCDRVSNALIEGVDAGKWTREEAWEAVNDTGDDGLWNAFCDAAEEWQS